MKGSRESESGGADVRTEQVAGATWGRAVSRGAQVAPGSWKKQREGFYPEASRRNAAVPKPGEALTLALQSCDTVPLCCLSHQVCGNLLQTQQEANTEVVTLCVCVCVYVCVCMRMPSIKHS